MTKEQKADPLSCDSSVDDIESKLTKTLDGPYQCLICTYPSM